MRPSFFLHLHPPSIPTLQARFRYTLGAGGLSVYFAIVIFITGMLEMFYYVPTPTEASGSIQVIAYLVPFGKLVRNMHYLAAQFLVITSAIHLLRVIFTGSYSPPRRFNYLLGLSLFILILLLDFTGYVLRWDEGVRWAIVAGTKLVESVPWIGPAIYRLLIGGYQPDSPALLRFYTWHIIGLVLLFTILFVWHLFKVRRDGGIAVPPPEFRKDSSRISRFELFRRETLASIIATAILFILSSFINAPIGSPMNTSNAFGNEARAPWFFLWVQYLLKLGDPFIFGVLIPVSVIAFFALIPYILPSPRSEELGKWFPRSGRTAQVITGMISLIIIVLSILAWLG